MTDTRLERLADLVLAMPTDRRRAFIAALGDDDLQMLERALAERAALGWRANPAVMAHQLSDGEYQLWPYFVLLGERFADAIRGADPKQLWNLPSQYGKTSMLAQWGPLWALDMNPKLRIMYVTYDADKAAEEGGKARDLAEEHQDQLRFRLRPDRRARARWATDQGGGAYYVGIHGGITGWPADVVVCDDLMKGWAAAHSEAQRKATWSIYTSQVRMRVQSEHAAIIIGGTRWHEDDPTGKALAAAEADPIADQFTHLRLPAIAEPRDDEPDPLGRAAGEPLEARRFSAAEVLARRAVLGSYLWTAMEQQRPAPEEGDELMRAWWRWTDQLPEHADAWCSSWDMKLKDKESGDFVVGQVWSRLGGRFYCHDQIRGQWSQAKTRVAVALLAARHPQVRAHLVENAGYGPEVIEQLERADDDYTLDELMADELGMAPTSVSDERQRVQALLRAGLSGLIPITPKGPKPVRARAVSPLLEAGDVWLPTAAELTWGAQLVDEAAAFPNGSHDDQVDTFSQALNWLSDRGPTTVATGRGRPAVATRQQVLSRAAGRQRYTGAGRR